MYARVRERTKHKQHLFLVRTATSCPSPTMPTKEEKSVTMLHACL